MASQLVDCYSGNPLRNPTIQTDETFVGTPWPGFNESTVVIVEPAAVDVTEFVLVDVADGNEFVRPTGSTGEAEFAANSTTVSPEETAESAAPTPTATPAPITRELNMVGLVDVNSTISAEISRDDNELIFEFDASPDDDELLEIYVTEAPANYEFVIELIAQDDGGSGGDAPAELADALRVDADGEISGEVGHRDEADYYFSMHLATTSP